MSAQLINDLFLCCRHLARWSRDVEQLQPVPHEDDQLGRDYHGSGSAVPVRVQLHAAGARVSAVRQQLRARLLGRRSRELPTFLQGQLFPAVLRRQVLWPQAEGVLSSLLCWRLHWTQAERLPGKLYPLFMDTKTSLVLQTGVQLIFLLVIGCIQNFSIIENYTMENV